MENKHRIWINPDGLRVLGVGEMMPDDGGWVGGWEDEAFEGESYKDWSKARGVAHSSLSYAVPNQPEPCRDPQPYRHVDVMGQAVQQSLFSIFIERTMPVVKKVLRPVPCISAWAGMIATFFWHSVHGVSEHPLESLGIELPEGYPETMIVGAIQTAIFVAWTICFKQTIREAIRKEFQAK